MKSAVFQIMGISNVTQLLFVQLSPDQSPLHFEQRINERPGIAAKIKLLGIEGELSPESLPFVYVAYRAKTVEVAQSIALRGTWRYEPTSDRRHSILFLEIHDDVSSVLREGMESNGFEVIRARNMGEAELIAQGPLVDVLLLDLRSLGDRALLGIQLLKACQPQAKVVLLSESDHWAVASKLSVMLDHSYLQKPFTLRLLLNTLRSALGKPAASRQDGV